MLMLMFNVVNNLVLMGHSYGGDIPEGGLMGQLSCVCLHSPVIHSVQDIDCHQHKSQ